MSRATFAWYTGGAVAGGLAFGADVWMLGWNIPAAVAGVFLGLLTGIVYTVASLAAGWPTPEWWTQQRRGQTPR